MRLPRYTESVPGLLEYLQNKGRDRPPFKVDNGDRPRNTAGQHPSIYTCTEENGRVWSFSASNASSRFYVLASRHSPTLSYTPRSNSRWTIPASGCGLRSLCSKGTSLCKHPPRPCNNMIISQESCKLLGSRVDPGVFMTYVAGLRDISCLPPAVVLFALQLGSIIGFDETLHNTARSTATLTCALSQAEGQYGSLYPQCARRYLLSDSPFCCDRGKTPAAVLGCPCLLPRCAFDMTSFRPSISSRYCEGRRIQVPDKEGNEFTE